MDPGPMFTSGYTDPRILLINQLESGTRIMSEAVDGFSEEEFFEQLPGRGESINWVFGHLAANEDWFLMKLTGSEQDVSADLHSLYRLDESAPVDRSKNPPGRDAILDLFLAQRERAIAAVQGADLSRWDEPAPSEMPPLFPTLGACFGILGTHQYWHLGQIMTIRQMLGKPDFRF